MEIRYYFKTKDEAEKFIDEASEIAGELTDANLKAAFPDLVLDKETDPGYAVKVIFGDYGATFVMYEMKEEKTWFKKFAKAFILVCVGYIIGKRRQRYVPLTKKDTFLLTVPENTAESFASTLSAELKRNHYILCKDTKKGVRFTNFTPISH